MALNKTLSHTSLPLVVMVSKSYSKFLEVIGIGIIPATVIAIIAFHLISRWAKRDAREDLADSQLARSYVAIFTLIIWATNLIWIGFIWTTDLYKAQFADVDRQWSFATSIFTLTVALPVVVLATSHWQETIHTASGSFAIESPAAVEFVVALTPRIVSMCSACASLEAFWSNPSEGWHVDNPPALFGKHLYRAGAMISILYTPVFTLIQPQTPTTVLNPIDLWVTQVDPRVIDIFGQAAQAAVFQLLTFP